jgi:addiction module RelE/StbE family toxin
MKVLFRSSFERSLKKVLKRKPQLEPVIEERVQAFLDDPFDPSLRTHKLHGELKDLCSFTVASDLRIIFYFNESRDAVFVDIGSHNDVY